MNIPQRIIILGGGTAGWLAANYFAHKWGERGTTIQLIESSDIGTIGVGEGSTPQLKAFFDLLGIEEKEWMPRCGATYKTGIEFVGWSNRPGFGNYFHPFPTSLDGFTAGRFFHHCRLMRGGVEVEARPDPFFLPATLAKQRLAPIPGANFPFQISYGYHFDAGLLGQFLREWAQKHGVIHVDAKVASVELAEDGDVAALIAEDGRRFEGDFFVDASGFRASIIEGALGERHLSFAGNLFNDSAVVAPTATGPEGPDVCTRATALSAGWAWRIPLHHRVGNGYVYSSRFIDEDTAASELRKHLGIEQDSEVRHLKMKVGRIDNSWSSNCLAVGLSQGFLEPLEATALHIVMATVGSFVDAVEAKGLNPATRTEFNRTIARRYEGIRDYLVCHYRAVQRDDTDYWRACRQVEDLSDSLKSLFTCWFTGGDLSEEVERQDIAGFYTATSWYCLLAGYGNFPDAERLRAPDPKSGNPSSVMDGIEMFISGCAMNFPSHREALEALG